MGKPDLHLLPVLLGWRRRWSELADLESTDADFDRFRRAGSARVVVQARPTFEEQVNLYTEIGVLWGGGPVPSPLDEHYISVAEEIRAQQQAPRDGDRGESWEVRLPTTLIWLENDAGLPVKPEADRKLDEPPGKETPTMTERTPASAGVKSQESHPETNHWTRYHISNLTKFAISHSRAAAARVSPILARLMCSRS